jgi:hypothetical protein
VNAFDPVRDRLEAINAEEDWRRYQEAADAAAQLPRPGFWRSLVNGVLEAAVLGLGASWCIATWFVVLALAATGRADVALVVLLGCVAIAGACVAIGYCTGTSLTTGSRVMRNALALAYAVCTLIWVFAVMVAVA